MDIPLAVAGLLLVALAVRDVWATVLHPDAEGLFAKGIRRGMWRLATVGGTWVPRWRRYLLSLAGPAIIADIHRLDLARHPGADTHRVPDARRVHHRPRRWPAHLP